ncbi:MAG TPA: VOC family protein [Candidatus Acidoferrales bacterium]|nr:VOC family protein [Candidatus Acidoferrales bacterium]
MIRGIHHTSRGVGDMDSALAFYRDLLGLRVVLDTEMAGEMLAREVGLEGARLRLVELEGGGQTMLELLQYLVPAGAPYPVDARCSDVGASHFALLVDDIRAAHRRLESAGVRFTYPPQEVDAGYFAGHWTAYCFDPDGQIVELWQLP